MPKRHRKIQRPEKHAAPPSAPANKPSVHASKHPGVPPLKLYHMAAAKYASHKYLEAATIYLEFVRTFPKHPYANNALYWAGESYYSLGEYKKAVFYFKAVIEKYPKGSKVPDSLLKLGYAYAELGKKKVAREYLFRLMDEYPFSEAAQKAQAKLDDLY
jgi:tol-pal system protein YbgF